MQLMSRSCIQVLQRNGSVQNVINYSWLTTLFPNTVLKSISTVLPVPIVTNTCLVKMKWQAFTKRCAWLPALAILSVLVNCKP